MTLPSGRALRSVPPLNRDVRPFGNSMQTRRAETTDEEALGSVRRASILGLAAPAISVEQAEAWANGAAADRIARAIREHDVWVAVEEVAIGWVEVDRDLNLLGMVDILFVVATAARLAAADPESMAALLRLPLSLLPTFLVPLIIASHVVLGVRLARRSAMR